MLEIIKKRRSVREYQPREVEEEKLNEVLKAAMFAPSSMHRRPWEFIVVKEKETREKLSKATQHSSFAQNASVVLILCANEETDPRWVEDLSIVAAYIYLETVNQGLGTCFIQIRDAKMPSGESAEEYVKKLTKTPGHIRILCLMPLGYPALERLEHSEQEFAKEKIHWERF